MPAGSLLLVDLTLGIALLATIGLAATCARLPAGARRQRLVGVLLVVVPLPVVVASLIALPSSLLGSQPAFGCGVLAFAVGAVLLLSGDGDGGDRGRESDPSPAPWWPDFETEFRAYVRERSRRRVPV